MLFFSLNSGVVLLSIQTIQSIQLISKINIIAFNYLANIHITFFEASSFLVSSKLQFITIPLRKVFVKENKNVFHFTKQASLYEVRRKNLAGSIDV